MSWTPSGGGYEGSSLLDRSRCSFLRGAFLCVCLFIRLVVDANYICFLKEEEFRRYVFI